MTSRAKVRLPLLAIVAAAVGLIAARMIWPKLNFDTTSLILFGIAAVAWALTFMPVSKLKFGDFEAEMAPMVAALGQKVTATEAAATARTMQTGDRRPQVVMRGDSPSESADPSVFEEYRAIVGSGALDGEKVVRVVDLVEQFARVSWVDSASREALDTLRDIRDTVVHRRAELTPSLTSEILDSAWRLLRTMAESHSSDGAVG